VSWTNGSTNRAPFLSLVIFRDQVEFSIFDSLTFGKSRLVNVVGTLYSSKEDAWGVWAGSSNSWELEANSSKSFRIDATRVEVSIVPYLDSDSLVGIVQMIEWRWAVSQLLEWGTGRGEWGRMRRVASESHEMSELDGFDWSRCRRSGWENFSTKDYYSSSRNLWVNRQSLGKGRNIFW